ncbi:MAG TPA: hypothetical protein PKG60_08920 [Spirochaetota bacterium]|nr:hypothetical protein [Spirochaetota bacterium]
MKLLKRLKHTTDKNGYSTELDILVYEKKIIWYMVEQTRFDDGDEITEDQPVDDYIKNGPPQFASGITAEIKADIDHIIYPKKVH